MPTIAGLEIIHRRGQCALVLVHSRELAAQWVEAIHGFLGIEVGLIGNGKWREGAHITVALIQTLSRRPRETVDMGGDYGLVLVDEAHHVPAATFAEMVDLLSATFRYGLTATPHHRWRAAYPDPSCYRADPG